MPKNTYLQTKENFAIYTYHKMLEAKREANRQNNGSPYTVRLKDFEILKIYTTDIQFREFIDAQYIIRKDQKSKTESLNGKMRLQRLLDNPESLARQRAKLQEMLQDSVLQSEKGKKGGRANVASGKAFISIAKAGLVSHSPATCVHCGKEGTRGSSSRNHNNNCKLKPEVIMPMLHRIPTAFLRSHLAEQFKLAGIEEVLQRGIENRNWFDVIGQWGSYKIYTVGPNYYKYLNDFPVSEDACDIENGLEEFLAKREAKRKTTDNEIHLDNVKSLYNELPTEFTRKQACELNSFKDRALLDIIKNKSLVDSYRPKKTSIAEGCLSVIYIKLFSVYP